MRNGKWKMILIELAPISSNRFDGMEWADWMILNGKPLKRFLGVGVRFDTGLKPGCESDS
jgi:hypothetical protein